MKIKMKRLFGIILSLVLALGLMPGMSMTAQAATTLTDTFTTNTGATEYTGNYSKVTASVASGYEGLGIAHSDNHPITIETLHGEIIDKVVLSGITNEQNVYVHPSSGNVTNTLWQGDCRYRLNADGAVEIENINSTTFTISFHPGYLGTCFYANVVVYCHEVPVDITGVELNKTSTSLTVGKTETLTATVNPDNSDHTVAWSSDNESVATVSNGVITAVAEGTATITVTATNGTDDTSDDKKATCAVTVNASSSGGSSDSGSGDSSGNNNSSNNSGNSNSEPKDETPFDYLDPLREDLKAEIALGGQRTVTWDKGTALPYDIMKTLQDNPGVTLIFSYTYQGIDYKVTISGKDAKAYTEIPWYGPLYLYKHYGSSSKTAPANTTYTTTGERTYTVLPGDTLIGLAGKLNTTVESLVSLNDIKNRDFILVGQILKY